MTGQSGVKLFYRIGEVSRLAGVRPYVLRYWESEFPALSPRKNRGGQRVYQKSDLDLVMLIKRMLHEEGYTIAGARKALAGRVHPKPPQSPFDKGGSQRQRDFSTSCPAEVLGRLREEIKDVLNLIK